MLIPLLLFVNVEILTFSLSIFFSFLNSPIIFFASEFTVPGIIGCLQALEAVKISAKVGDPLSGRMLLLDAMSARMRIVCFMIYDLKVLSCLQFPD